jgi:hypothetical protein
MCHLSRPRCWSSQARVGLGGRWVFIRHTHASGHAVVPNTVLLMSPTPSHQHNQGHSRRCLWAAEMHRFTGANLSCTVATHVTLTAETRTGTRCSA